MDTTSQTDTWPDLAIGLYDKLPGRGAEIEDDFDLYVPSGTGDAATHTQWKVNGTTRVRTRDSRNGGAAGGAAGGDGSQA